MGALCAGAGRCAGAVGRLLSRSPFPRLLLPPESRLGAALLVGDPCAGQCASVPVADGFGHYRLRRQGALCPAQGFLGRGWRSAGRVHALAGAECHHCLFGQMAPVTALAFFHLDAGVGAVAPGPMAGTPYLAAPGRVDAAGGGHRLRAERRRGHPCPGQRAHAGLYRATGPDAGGGAIRPPAISPPRRPWRRWETIR